MKKTMLKEIRKDLEARRRALLEGVPESANGDLIRHGEVQRGSIGTFAYVVKQDKSVTVRPLLLGPTEGDNVAVTSGLSDGEMVVVVGGDKLREGTKVEVVTEESAGASRQGKKPMREGGRREKPQNKDK